MTRHIDNETVVSHLTGSGLGRTDGTMICDGCGTRERVQAQETRREWQGYATTGANNSPPVHLLKIYCPSCTGSHGTINTATRGVGEWIVDLFLQRPTDTDQVRVLGVEVVEVSQASEGIHG